MMLSRVLESTCRATDSVYVQKESKEHIIKGTYRTTRLRYIVTRLGPFSHVLIFPPDVLILERRSHNKKDIVISRPKVDPERAMVKLYLSGRDSVLEGIVHLSSHTRCNPLHIGGHTETPRWFAKHIFRGGDLLHQGL